MSTHDVAAHSIHPGNEYSSDSKKADWLRSHPVPRKSWNSKHPVVESEYPDG